MLTQAIEVMKYIRASAGRSGLAVVFEEENKPRHDGKTIYLPKITYKTTEDQLKELMASVDHEVAHDRFSCFEVLKEKKVLANNILAFVWNFLEDSRVNAIEAKEYKGFKNNYDETTSKIIPVILNKAKKENSPVSKITIALLCWETKLSSSFFPSIELSTNTTIPDKKITNVLNNYSDRLTACHKILEKRLGTETTYQLAFDILTEIGKKCPPKEEEDKKVKVENDTKDKSIVSKVEDKPFSLDNKDDEDEKIPKESTKDDIKTGDLNSSKKKERLKEEEYQILEIVLTKEDLDNFSLTMPEEGDEMGKVGINFKPVDLSSVEDWDVTDYNKFIVVDYPNKLGPDVYFNTINNDKFLKGYKLEVESKLVTQENFAQQVRKLIQIRAKVQTQYGTKKGKLDQSKLSRICFSAPGFNDKIFKTKIENKTLDVAITVLIDMSGSMGGLKAYNALASALLLNEVCSTLTVPIEILGFTDGRHSKLDVSPMMFIYKSFSNLKVSTEDLTKYFATSSNFMAGNPDGENILWAYDRLLKRKEKKKILIVMSDGSPAASKSSSGLEKFTLKVIKEIEEAKKVSIYGLGLCSKSVCDYYKANSVINDPNEIPSKLISLIESKVLNV